LLFALVAWWGLGGMPRTQIGRTFAQFAVGSHQQALEHQVADVLQTRPARPALRAAPPALVRAALPLPARGGGSPGPFAHPPEAMPSFGTQERPVALFAADNVYAGLRGRPLLPPPRLS
jgi:hypothetical protein